MAGESGEQRAEEALERARPRLHALPGVVATGIGLSEEEGAERIVQVFVRSEEDVEPVRSSATEVLGDVPFEVIVSGEVVAGEN